MIAFLNGRFVGKNSTSAFIDVNGVGFEVLMSQSGLMDLTKADSSVSVYTYLHISDTGATLYGFLSSEEVEMFKKLIGVSGIGPKIALAALSTFKPSELISAIVAQDVSRVSKIPGVGKKSAQRIILELKDKSDLSFVGTSGTHEDATASTSALFVPHFLGWDLQPMNATSRLSVPILKTANRNCYNMHLKSSETEKNVF